MSVRGSEQAVVTDFDEMVRQDVLKKTADELFGADGREFDLIGRRILVRESDLSVLEFDDALVADGDAKDVRSEVFEGGGACAYRLRVNDPIFAPDLLIKEMEETVVSRPGQFNIGLLAQQVQCSVAVLAADPRKQNSFSLSLSSLESHALRRPNLECDHMQKEYFEL